MVRVKKSVHRRSESKSLTKVRHPLFRGIPTHSPSLWQAYLLTERASRVGFDWPSVVGVLKKLDEEVKELKEAVSSQNRRRMREEFGDLLFVLVNVARFLRINPEEALRGTLKKFKSRFNYIETSLRKKGKTFQQSSLTEMDRLWEEAKKRQFRG